MELSRRLIRQDSAIWFARLALYYFPLLLILFVALADREKPWLAASLVLSAVVLWAALKTRQQASNFFRIALLVSMAIAWSYLSILAFAGPGDTQICYDRVRQTAFRGPLVNEGPDPYCEGRTLDDLHADQR